jgi:hypothetical protein
MPRPRSSVVKCRHCGRELKSSSGRIQHERACTAADQSSSAATGPPSPSVGAAPAPAGGDPSSTLRAAMHRFWHGELDDGELDDA